MIPSEVLSQVGTPITVDTQISFLCHRCGDCCRDRLDNPICLTGYDMYRLAGALGMRSTIELIEMRIVFVQPNRYGLPVCALSVTPEGACCLLDGNYCAVHEVKPAVCEMYPLGRLYDAAEGAYTYIHPHGNSCIGSGNGDKKPAMQWLTSVEKDAVFHAAYETAYVETAEAFLNITHTRYLRKAYYRTIWALFCGFDPHKDFFLQLEENMRGLRPLLEKAIKKSR